MKGLRLLLRLFTWRHWRGAPGTSLLLVLTLALGVAVYLSIRLANKAAMEGFADFTELVAVRSDFILRSPAGGLPEGVLVELREALEDFEVHLIPVVETTAARPRGVDEVMAIGQRESFTLLGLDLVGLLNLQAGTLPEGVSGIQDERGVFVSEALAKKEGLAAGSEFRVVIQDRVVSLTVAGVLPQREEVAQMPETLLLMDLPALQRVAEMEGMLDRVEMVLPKETQRREAMREVLVKFCGERWQLVTPEDRREAASMMTRAFRWNLGILSMLALLVGLYLVFQALDGAVVRRREETAILSSLGVRSGDLRRMWLVESALLGVAGGLVGTMLGWAGAQAAVGLVGQTVNTLYHQTQAKSVMLSWGDFGVAMGLGIGASLVAGWWPAKSAAMTPPAQLLSRHAPQPLGAVLWRRWWLGPMLLLVGLVLAWLPPLRLEGGARLALAGYVAALCWVLGGGVTAGNGLRFFARGLERVVGGSVMWRFALSHLRRASSRHRLAVAALLCAVAMTAGMSVLVGSFDKTMRGWIERTFQADIYVSSDGAQGAASRNLIRLETQRKIASHPGVAEVNGLYFQPVQLAEGETMLAGSDLGFLQRHVEQAWLEEPVNEAVFDVARNEGLCLVSESFQERFQKRRGDVVRVPTPEGVKDLTIAGVFADYGNERGTVSVDRVHLAKWLKEESASRLILMVKDGVDAEVVKAELVSEFPGLSVFTNAHLRGEVMRIFRQTFAITHALELIGVVVAVIGLGMTLASVQLERRGELTTLRALGLTRKEMARSTAWEGVLLALGGVVSGLVLSLALGWLLVYVINKQTFGWTLQFYFPWVPMGILAGLILLSAWGVSYSVGRWGANLPADREE
ncbi:FtsX-like permease family protein [Phragmitibacter flavus]|uniref:FtsX-like permease family protein n=1 Tax=Phragmitibacter flavus TaxID=2576071 RepID=A0A5R8KG82_9BACT|nr:FtsX-like permease family protein [Phragmitibacter flavus]TLD70609.1 FtsX-like permease family protein [Phragmitibacter flavus]